MNGRMSHVNSTLLHVKWFFSVHGKNLSDKSITSLLCFPGKPPTASHSTGHPGSLHGWPASPQPGLCSSPQYDETCIIVMLAWEKATITSSSRPLCWALFSEILTWLAPLLAQWQFSSGAGLFQPLAKVSSPMAFSVNLLFFSQSEIIHLTYLCASLL